MERQQGREQGVQEISGERSRPLLHTSMDEPTREGALLDLSLMNKEELIRELKADGNLGCSDQELVEFKILRSVQDKRVELHP